MFVRSLILLAISSRTAFPNPLSKRADDRPPGPVQLTGFDECSTDQRLAIEAAWDNAIEMAATVRVQGGQQAEEEILGKRPPAKFLIDVGTVIGNAAKLSRNINSDMKIRIRCDDDLAKSVFDPKNPLEQCRYPGIAKEDGKKCNSRCWDWNNNDKRFVPKARAYAKSNPRGMGEVIAYINFCPSFFDAPTCEHSISKWGNSHKDDFKLDLVNYECQGHMTLHELFHIDNVYQGVNTPDANKAVDRIFELPVLNAESRDTRAYGPQMVKTLSNYGDGGESVVNYQVLTNADSLAVYALAKFVTLKIGAYPDRPYVTESPSRLKPNRKIKRDDSDGVSYAGYAIINKDNVMTVSSLDNLAAALGVPAEDVWAIFEATDKDCATTGLRDCIDDPDNKPIKLIPNDDAPTSADGTPPKRDAPPAATCTTVTTLVWKVQSNDPLADKSNTPNSQQWDTMTFTVSGKYTGVSSPETQIVWADQDTASAHPKLGSAPGPLPAFLIQTYDHDRDWVQYNYQKQAWASSDKQCKDPNPKWDGPQTKDGRPQRVITCTFDC